MLKTYEDIFEEQEAFIQALRDMSDEEFEATLKKVKLSDRAIELIRTWRRTIREDIIHESI